MLSIFTILVFSFYSCDKEDTSEMKDMFVYTSSGNSTYNISTGELIKTVGASELSKGLSFGLTITRPSNNDISVKAEIDTNLIGEYDRLKGTVSTRYDLTKFELTSDEIVIPAGSIHSSGNFSIISNSFDIEILTPCVIPIRITALGSAQISKSRDIMYLVITGQKIVTSSFATIFDRVNSSYSPLSDVFPKVGFPINLNVGLPNAIKVSVEYDKSLVDTYNQKNNAAFLKLPDGSFVLKSTEVNIQEGALVSKDSIKIEFPDRSKFELGKEYLIPIKISKAENAFISETNGVKYIVFKPVVNNIDPSNTPINGGVQMDRTGWTVTASGRYSNFVIENILDGNNATAWDANRPAWFILDMKSVKSVKGFSFVPNYQYRSENILGMDVLSSDDGVTCVEVGKYAGTTTLSSSTPANPDIKTVRFYSPVSARYFRFNITNGSSGSYTGMNELFAIN